MSLKREILVGTAWVTGARWGIRGLGIISTLILARLLVPDDFGIVALATMISGAIAIFGEIGLLLHLIREPNPDRSHFDTVWTLRTLIGAVLSVLIVAAGPIAAPWFNDPRLATIVPLLGLTTLMQGLQNPGTAWFRKNLDFRREFIFLVVQKLAGFAVTLILAFHFRNYWALLCGILASSLAGLIFSYTMHPFRPRFDLSRTRAVWGFSLWMLGASLAEFLSERVDTLMIGRFRTTTDVGIYAVAQDLATSPVVELAAPAARVLFPAFSKVLEDKARLGEVFARAFAGLAILVFALGPGVALVAEDAVAVLLGPTWRTAVPLIQVLALSAMIYGVAQPMYSLLNVLGRPNISTYLILLQLVLLVVLTVPALLLYDMLEMAMARVVAMLAALVVTSLVFARIAKVSLRSILVSLWRPAIAAAAMAVAVRFAQGILPDIALLRLVLVAAVGGLVYPIVLLLLWILVGRPNTVEADLVATARLEFLLGQTRHK